MNRQSVSGEVMVTGDLDCIELIEEGCLIISEKLTTLTINKLINHKTCPCINDFDILVTGEDGKDAAHGTGENGEDGHNGGEITIRVKDLEGDIHIKASGGKGGAGGTGQSGAEGGKGGDGGDGGDGAVVEFYYDRKDPDSTSYVYVYSAKGGKGGFGGNGGECTSGRGTGGRCGQEGTKGGRFGDGGKGGAMGKDGKITIHHPDGGVSVNGIECEAGEKASPAAGQSILDLRKDRDLRIFIQAYGGEAHLKEYPKIWSAVKKIRETGGVLCREGLVDSDSQIMFETDMAQVIQIGVGTGVKAACGTDAPENAGEAYKFYKFAVPLQVFYYNSLPAVSDTDENAPVCRLTGCVVRLELKDKNSGDSYQKMTLFYEDGVEHMLKEIETEEVPFEEIEGRELMMEANISYVDQEQELIPLEPIRQTFRFNRNSAVSYIKKITVTDPHWHTGKSSGTVKFLYGRTPENNPELLKDADYWDQDGPYHRNSGQGRLRTIIPLSGDIELRDVAGGKVTGAKIGSFILQNGAEVKRSELYYTLEDDKFTFAKYRSDIPIDRLGEKLQENGSLTYDSTKKTARFDLKLPVEQALSPYDWHSDITGTFLNQSIHKGYLSGHFVLEVEHEKYAGSDHEVYEINIYGNDDFPDTQTQFYVRENGTTVFIPPIEIYWGCFAKDTQIRIADGSTKRADRIVPGDRIPALGGENLTVAEVLTGEDREIIRIVTEDGNRIRVSGGHAMLVSDGTDSAGRRVAAGRLQPGDSLMTPCGEAAVSEVMTEPYNDRVYNFIFEGEEKPNYIEADGYWSGDFYAQNEKKKPVTAQLGEEAVALRDELRKFAGR